MSQDGPHSCETASSGSVLGKRKEPPVEDDEHYCFDSAFVYIQVQQKLFHIPTYRFTDESHVFAGMFNLPQSKTADSEGFSRTRPIFLPQDITSRDFQNFLKALYPRSISIRLSLTTDEWLSTLRLATYWYFLNVRKMAIKELEQTKALISSNKIVFGREFKIESWVLSGMLEMVKRKETISTNEVHDVNFETAFSLFRIRDKRLQNEISNGDQGLKEAIRMQFKEELDTILQYEKEYEIEEEVLALDPLANKTPKGDAGNALEPASLTSAMELQSFGSASQQAEANRAATPVTPLTTGSSAVIGPSFSWGGSTTSGKKKKRNKNETDA